MIFIIFIEFISRFLVIIKDLILFSISLITHFIAYKPLLTVCQAAHDLIPLCLNPFATHCARNSLN